MPTFYRCPTYYIMSISWSTLLKSGADFFDPGARA
ncbi:hypothetical protein SAMN04490182_2035 [Pseudomonas cedrina]|uniref:Uncharacterized protein n=1 Tax=Pseudomonas cedrina TaxID=651740 RepID=A0ABY0UGG7_PSECE|nr:hypothetical protein SAMN04490182_2035 [Pseudomonas cedrina]